MRRNFKLMLVCAISWTCCSCTISLKDLIKGDPFKRSYEMTYQDAIAEGLSHDEAQRRALLVGGDNDNKVSARRKRERKEDREEARRSGKKRDKDWLDVKWD